MVRFSSIENFFSDVSLQKELRKHFPNIPQLFWSRTCVQHNGFFGTKASADSTSHGPASMEVQTWFRMIIKIMKRMGNRSHSKSMVPQWYEMSFLSSFSKTRNLLLCFDTPKAVARDMFSMLSEDENQDAATGPYGLHQPLLEQLLVLYDESIWSIAEVVRENDMDREQGKGPKNDKETDLALNMYEQARHATHSIEATQEAAKVVACIAQHCESLASRRSMHQQALYNRCEIFKFYHTMMQGFLSRAYGNERRMDHSKNLSLSFSSALDRRFNQMIATLAREDSASMKAIAYVTMTFLPATFVSALLGMNFFNFSPDEHHGHITYSHDLWIYFVISVVFTLVLFVMYWIWQQYRRKARAQSSIEDENAVENAYATVEREHAGKIRPQGLGPEGSRRHFSGLSGAT
ncbi:hypothetical protein E4T48_01306 [Aureobasidium sp. EXF-10727]|nr:hypothetical protein E4T48_01306 [Aureobasidium sp. EXF-10727]